MAKQVSTKLHLWGFRTPWIEASVVAHSAKSAIKLTVSELQDVLITLSDEVAESRVGIPTKITHSYEKAGVKLIKIL